MGGDERAQAFAVEQPPDEAGGDRPVRLGQRLQHVDIDAGTGDEGDAIRVHAEIGQRRAVVGVLHQRGGARAIEQAGQQPFQGAAGDPRAHLRRHEGEAPAGHRVEANKRQAGRGQRSDHGRLQRHVMHQVGRQGAIEAANLPDHGQEAERADVAASPPDRMDLEPVLGDRSLVAGDIGEHVHVVAGLLGGPRHRQPVREEIPSPR